LDEGTRILQELLLAKLRGLQTPDAAELQQAWPGLARVEAAPEAVRNQEGLDFDGDRDYVVLPSVQFDGRPPWTLEAIVKYVWYDGNPAFSRILSAADAGSIMLQPQEQKWSIDMYTGGYFVRSRPSSWAWAPGDAAAAKSDTELKVKQWQHVAGIWDGTELRIYVDGQLQKQRAKADSCTRLSGFPFFLGAGPARWSENEVAGGCMRGRLRAARISRGIEYTTSFTSPTSLEKTPSTIALYDFCIDTGRYAIDRSGHGNHGIIVGAKFIKTGTPEPTATNEQSTDPTTATPTISDD
jgi:hypothetical protein